MTWNTLLSTLIPYLYPMCNGGANHYDFLVVLRNISYFISGLFQSIIHLIPFPLDYAVFLAG